MPNEGTEQVAGRQGPASHPLFVYGTLEVTEVMRAVIGRPARFSTAVALGHQRFMVRDRVFPGMTPAPGRTTVGRLYAGFSARELERLDEFESAFYERREISVYRPNRGVATAFAYVIPIRAASLLDERPWDRSLFVRNRLAEYLS